MTLSRWKLTTGLLGLALGGLVATADPPCPAKANAAPGGCGHPPGVVLPPVPAATTVTAIQVAFQPPVEVPPPTPAALPEFVLVSEPPKPVDVPKPQGLPKAELPGIALPDPPKPAAALPPPVVSGGDPLTSAPVKIEPPKIELPVPALPGKVVDLPLPSVELAKPTAAPPPVADPLPPPKAEPAPPAVADPAVKVNIHLGGGPPTFDVLTGDDTLLKVVCDALDVKTPGDKGRPMSAIKAAKNVKFTATWCEGTCNELSVHSDTGEVVLVGDVRVRTKRGKGETQIVASQMTFKLGTAPAYSVAEVSGPGTMSTASFRK